MKKRRGISLSYALIGGVGAIGVIACIVASYIGYREFTAVLEKQYNDAAYEIADTALTLVDGDKVEEYLKTGKTDDAYWATEDKLNSLLNDPEQMNRITEMAKSLMGGSGDGDKKDAAGGSDADMAAKISKLLKKTGAGENDRTALLNAMKPYLSSPRRDKMDKAMRIARLAEIAELAAGEFGGSEDV